MTNTPHAHHWIFEDAYHAHCKYCPAKLVQKERQSRVPREFMRRLTVRAFSYDPGYCMNGSVHGQETIE